MPDIAPEGLSEFQVEHFVKEGFIRLDDAFSPCLAEEGQEEL
ncbi:hypothetical protein [Rubellimicrobium arenae]|nr:hypothetical protein [Rubellimicrobium arenae]